MLDLYIYIYIHKHFKVSISITYILNNRNLTQTDGDTCLTPERSWGHRARTEWSPELEHLSPDITLCSLSITPVLPLEIHKPSYAVPQKRPGHYVVLSCPSPQ